MSMRSAIAALPAGLALVVAAGCGRGDAARPAVVDAYGTRVETEGLGRELHLFTWPDYIDPALIVEFESAYGVELLIDYYDTNEAMMAKLQAGGTGQYDLIVGSDYAIEALGGAALLQPLDHAAIPNLRNLAARFRDAPYDPGNVYSAAYQWGTTGVGVRSDLVDTTKLEPSWELLFDPASQAGPFTMLSDVRETIAAALIYLGHSPNATAEDELAEAERLLVAQRERLLTYAAPATSRDLLASGDAVVAHAFSGDVLQVADEVPSIRYLIPREGSIVWTDNLAIPKGAPEPRLAGLFINFILDAQVGARLSDYTRYATPNDASLPLVSAELRADPAIYPDSAVMSRLEFLRDVGAARAAYDRIWTRLRAGAEGR
jgi:spermidine/putrescine transport system substrate-binding protein